MWIFRAAAALGALALVASSCGSDDTATPDSVPTVVATTTIWADVVSNVACNGLAAVQTIVPAGGDPHSFEPSLKDRETMGDATLVVANGLGLEESMTDLIDAVESDGVEVIRVGEFVDTIPAGDHDTEDNDTAEESADDDHGDEDHGADDPHIWYDPTRVSATLPAIADALATAGLDRTALDACVSDFTDRLASLDADVSSTVAAIPVDERLLVTSHDSLSYFADRYDFEILGSVIPSPSSLSATNPAALVALADTIEETGVPAIFAETQHSSSDTQALADRVGDVAVVTLQTGTLGPPGSETATYIDWLSTTARTIVTALAT